MSTLASAGVTIVRVPLRRFMADPEQLPSVLAETVNRFAEHRHGSAT